MKICLTAQGPSGSCPPAVVRGAPRCTYAMLLATLAATPAEACAILLREMRDRRPS